MNNLVTARELAIDYSSSDPEALADSDRQAHFLLDKYGCFLAKGVFGCEDLVPIRRDIKRLIELRMKRAGLNKAAFESDQGNFDDQFLQLNELDRAHGGVIYNACRRLMPVHQIAVAPKLVRMSKTLMSTETIIACTLNAVRIDHPNEDKFLFPWHQDYPYVQDSEDALVYWIPLRDVNEEDGCLTIALGSHRRGILPLRVDDPFNRNKNGARTVAIADFSVLNEFQKISLPVREGEFLVFSTLTLHASGPNRGKRARWTVQVRHGNFENPKAVSRDWPGGMIEGVRFEQTHPEYVVNLAELRPSAIAAEAA
jgi:Phytanoyl-CoA dioxygenase (PhyH)